MKRKNYTIKVDGIKIATKHAWNSARNEVVDIIRDLLPQGIYAKLTNPEYRKDDDGFFYGSEIWASDCGRKYHVEIEMV